MDHIHITPQIYLSERVILHSDPSICLDKTCYKRKLKMHAIHMYCLKESGTSKMVIYRFMPNLTMCSIIIKSND